MSGHSKWSTIKHQKGAADAKRGKVFTKLGHAITVAAREGGGDPIMNARLALAIEMAKKQNMPKDNIDRAIKRATGELGGAAAEDVNYEGYGPGGTAIFIEGLTDNRNRTSGEIRAVFNKLGGKLGETGSVAYLFQKRGVITVEAAGKSADDLEVAVIESGADDYELLDGELAVYTDPKELQSVKVSLEAAGLPIAQAELRYEPNQTIQITDPKVASQIIRIMNALEDLDDVTNVTSNFDVDEATMNQIEQ
jgi:YebC/PmpR family DNA-binding regulatory protein